mmetsp:Transcript_44784/g.88647  ORF Transcript_44784/g.88647 Transcript_44784/m.88647 type:complete len:211 (-) Transcript_44784:140-772(-)
MQQQLLDDHLEKCGSIVSPKVKLPRLSGGGEGPALLATCSCCLIGLLSMMFFCFSTIGIGQTCVLHDKLSGAVLPHVVTKPGLHFTGPLKAFVCFPQHDTLQVPSVNMPNPSFGREPVQISCDVQIELAPQEALRIYSMFGGYTAAKQHYLQLIRDDIDSGRVKMTPEEDDMSTAAVTFTLLEKIKKDINEVLEPEGAHAVRVHCVRGHA